MLFEVLAHHILAGLETKVANEQGGRGLIGHITIFLAAVLAALLRVFVLTWSAEVDADLAIVEVSAVLGLKGSCGVTRIDELHITETLAPA